LDGIEKAKREEQLPKKAGSIVRSRVSFDCRHSLPRANGLSGYGEDCLRTVNKAAVQTVL